MVLLCWGFLDYSLDIWNVQRFCFLDMLLCFIRSWWLWLRIELCTCQLLRAYNVSYLSKACAVLFGYIPQWLDLDSVLVQTGLSFRVRQAQGLQKKRVFLLLPRLSVHINFLFSGTPISSSVRGGDLLSLLCHPLLEFICIQGGDIGTRKTEEVKKKRKLISFSWDCSSCD